MEKLYYLFENEKWGEARKILRQLLKDDPSDHWVLTNIGLTFYEQRKYKEALKSHCAGIPLI